MRKFEVCIRGDNFLVDRGRGARKNGFYAVRFIEARDTSDAVDIAMNSFREELKGVVLNDPSDPPVMKVADVRDVYFFEETMEVGDIVLPGHGFLWDE